MTGSVAVASEYAEQEEEEVDEVKVERESSLGCKHSCIFGGGHLCHGFHLLGVPCGEAYEDKYSGK